MGETELRGSILQGDGIYKSVDAGKTWRKSGLADTQAVSRIRIHPRNPDLIYVAALGHPYGPNGGGFCTEAIEPAPSISAWIRTILKCFTHRCGTFIELRGYFRAAGPAADCSNPSTAVTPGPI